MFAEVVVRCATLIEVWTIVATSLSVRIQLYFKGIDVASILEEHVEVQHFQLHPEARWGSDHLHEVASCNIQELFRFLYFLGIRENIIHFPGTRKIIN